jgi:hypothetical protein
MRWGERGVDDAMPGAGGQLEVGGGAGCIEGNIQRIAECVGDEMVILAPVGEVGFEAVPVDVVWGQKGVSLQYGEAAPQLDELRIEAGPLGCGPIPQMPVEVIVVAVGVVIALASMPILISHEK